MIKLLTLGILFSSAVRELVVAKLVLLLLGILPLIGFILGLRQALVAKLVILRISYLTSFILALRVVLVAKLVMSCILSSMFFILAFYASFLTT